MSQVEYRPGGCFSGSLSLRESDEGESRTLVGISPPWDTLSTEGRLPFREKFERGAFKNLDENIVATIQHDDKMVLGSTRAGTLRLSDTEDGLRFEVDLPNTTAANDLLELVKRGEIQEASFEFMVPDGGDVLEKKSDGLYRTVRSAILRQVGPVLRGAYGDPVLSMRCEQALEDASIPWKREIAKRKLALAESEVL